MFLCLELANTTQQSDVFPNYSEESLGAIKFLLREILPRLEKTNKTTYSDSLVHLSNNLIKAQINLALLSEFSDAFNWANFELTQRKNSKEFVLSLPDDEPKTKNPFILNHLKTRIKRDFTRNESQPKISEEEHFKKIDPKLKTNKGLATAFYSSELTPIEKNSNNGFISLQIDDSFFEGITSNETKKRDESIAKIMLLQLEQNFHYYFRQALSQVYQPNDEVGIHTLQLEINGVLVSLFDLICVMSCLIAKAVGFKTINNISHGSVNDIKQKLKDPQTFLFVEHENILNWLKKIEELKDKPETELNAMIELITRLDLPLPFNPLYKIDEKYYFSYESCCRFNLSRLLYDNYVSDKLFNTDKKTKEEKTIINKIQKDREINFTNSLKELFKNFTPFCGI
ncbi:MAG TPA: hypothetical protein PLP27_00145 [Crocinitomicaceae bacterium]|nr:hypothetical protein [Crocinitomicaceae bacterium]